MIDFRYHLVSLISVFLALAVGIVLGAGPLKEAIGDTLTGEVEQLRERADELRDELDVVGLELDQAEDALAAVAPDLLADVLGERRVAVVALDVAADTVADVVERIGQAGGDVTANVQITDEWTAEDRRPYRDTLAATLSDYLLEQPAPDATTETQLAEALVQGLTGAASDDEDLVAEDAAVMLELLTEGQLISVADPVALPADAMVLLVGTPEPGADEEAAAPDAQQVAEDLLPFLRPLALTAQVRTEGVVVGVSGVLEDGVLSLLLEDDVVASRITTVAGVETLVGEISVPLALAVRIDGNVAHYGLGQEGALVPPRVVLAPIERGPILTEDPTDPGEAE